MKTRIPPFMHRYLGATLITLLLLPCSTYAQGDVRTTTASDKGVNTKQLRSMTATVTAVDMTTRIVNLKDVNGEETSLTVSEDVKRLHEVKVGDKLTVGYTQSMGLEFRKPTEEEMANPLKVTEEIGRAHEKDAPAGGKAYTTTAVVTLEGMSRWLNTLTVRGPRGNYLAIQVEPGMVKWEDLRIGQQMVGTYTEAMVMSLEPAMK